MRRGGGHDAEVSIDSMSEESSVRQNDIEERRCGAANTHINRSRYSHARTKEYVGARKCG